MPQVPPEKRPSTQRRQGRDDRDRSADQQRPPPRGVLGEHAAEQQADRPATAGDRAVHTEGAGPLLGLGEGDRQQRQRRRRHQGTEGALQRPGGEEHAGVLRDAAERGCGGEAEQPDDEGALAPGVVGDPPAEQEEPAEGEGVGGDHPLPVGVADVQLRLRGGQGDVDDRRVEHDEKLGDRDDGQGEPAAGSGIRRYIRRWCDGLSGHRHDGPLDRNA
jgi:hypothetical protein